MFTKIWKSVFLITFLFLLLVFSIQLAFGQEIEWIRQYGTAGFESAGGISIDSSGIYVGGGTSGTFEGQSSAGGQDAFIRRYDSNGNIVWTRQFGTLGPDSVGGVSTDSTGIYVAGTVSDNLPGQTGLGSNDAFIRKYDFNGNIVWTRQFGTSVVDFGGLISVHSTGVYTAGTTYGNFGFINSGLTDVFVSKYDSDGNLIWTKGFGGVAYDAARGISVDSSGIYVAGFTAGTLPGQINLGSEDAFVRKYDFDGNVMWTRQFGTVDSDTTRGIYVSSVGVYAVGFTNGTFEGQSSAGGQDAFIRKYDSNGNIVWTRQFGTLVMDGAEAIFADTTGIYMTGGTSGALLGQTNFGDRDAFVRKYDFNGNIIWTTQFGTSFYDEVLGISTDSTGVYVVGPTSGTLSGQINLGNGDAFLIKLTLGSKIPLMESFAQFKSDEIITIPESSTTTESTVVFKANVSDPNNDQVKLQVELKEMNQSFDGTSLVESAFIFSGSEAITTKDGLINGQYRWRARTVDIGGNASNWQEFGVAGNIDFEVKTVPLYTQRISPYPSEAETTTWALTDYAEGPAGNYDCGSTITDCGCAITSAVILLRYYGITKGADGQDVTPGNINAWLNTHQGYIEGNIKWPKVWEYSAHPQNAVRLQFDGAVNFKDIATLDQYVQALKPTILHNRSFGHFLVADGKLSATHTIKDPAFYNTKYLAATGTTPFVKNYNNHFDGLRLFSTSTAEPAGIYFSLGSPAELLVTDSDGRRSGKDPITGINYSEIPGSAYFQEGLSSDSTETPAPPKEVKYLWIPQPVSGQYSIKVVGTGSGSYIFDSLAYDAQGQSHVQTFSGNTQSALVSEYDLNFTPQQPENITTQLISEQIDECPTIGGGVGNIGCPAKIDFLSLEKIANSAGVPELVGPGGAVRYTAPVVEGQRGTTEVSAKLYKETALLNLLGNPKRIPLDQLCAVFDDQTKDVALMSRLIKKTDTEGKYFFGVPSATTTYALIESVRETIAGQMKRVCVLETIFPRHFDSVTNIAFREVNKVVTTTRETRTGEILVKKQAGHTSQTLSAGESLWSLVKNILGNDSPAKIYIAAKRAAELNSIAIPEWGLYGGQFDAKNLRAGLIINASLFEE